MLIKEKLAKIVFQDKNKLLILENISINFLKKEDISGLEDNLEIKANLFYLMFRYCLKKTI